MDEKVLKALGEPRRFQLLQLMARRGYCVRALAWQSRLSEPAVSQHLKVLREAGLVYGVKRGYYTHYSLNKEALDQLIRELEQLKNAQRILCEGPYYGCEAAELVQCKTRQPQEKRGNEDA